MYKTIWSIDNNLGHLRTLKVNYKILLAVTILVIAKQEFLAVYCLKALQWNMAAMKSYNIRLDRIFNKRIRVT